MATRFAGDFFGIPLVAPGEDERSSLVKYFPDLRSIKKGSQESSEQPDLGPARSFGGSKAVTPFAGFKTFEVSNEKKAAPLFAGFKTFEQPTRRDSGSAAISDQRSPSSAAREISEVDPDVLKVLGIA